VSVRVRVTPFPSAPVGGDEELARGAYPAASAELSLRAAQLRSPAERFGLVPRAVGELTRPRRRVDGARALRLSNDESADRLVVTPTTAETRFSRAKVKLRDRDDAQLVLFAYETRLALPPANAQPLDRRPLSPGDVAPSPSIAEHLRRSVAPIESTIPTDMTAEHWRRSAPRGPRPHGDAPLASSLRRGASCRSGPVPCDHVPHSSTRYDHVEKLLSFLPVYPVCGTESSSRRSLTRLTSPHTRQPGAQLPGATVHRLPVRRRRPPLGHSGAGPMRPSATATVHRRRTNGQTR
jgi:hypothetical protein